MSADPDASLVIEAGKETVRLPAMNTVVFNVADQGLCHGLINFMVKRNYRLAENYTTSDLRIMVFSK